MEENKKPRAPRAPKKAVEEPATIVEETEVPVVVEEPATVEDEKIKVGEAYVVRLNKSLGIMQSKYSIRIKTESGFKEVDRFARNKACAIANSLNKSHGFATQLKIED